MALAYHNQIANPIAGSAFAMDDSLFNDPFPPEPSTQSLLDNLNESQAAAVTHGTGPLLILAGPGSGKTRVITRRVAWLLQNGIHASRILAITFTNKAAQEMRHRVEALVHHSQVHISTFHSFGVRLLREFGQLAGLERNFVVYDMDDREKLLKLAIEDAGIAPTASNVGSFGNAISKCKNQLVTPENYSGGVRDYFGQSVAKIYPRYQVRLKGANACDFDDLLYIPALLLQRDPVLREQLDNRWHYTLVDEYQDTNKAQYAIARDLNINHPNLCVVGDPDQSIYRFRGSDIRNIMDFERDYPNTKVIKLGENYRSTRNILAVADTLIRKNSERKPKPLVTNNQQGKPVNLTIYETGESEASGVAQKIVEIAHAKRWNYRDIAVFVRTNALTRTLEGAFIRSRIPFQIVKGLAFFERKENKDVLAYLRLMVNPRDDIGFLRIVNEPARKIGKTTLDQLVLFAKEQGLCLMEAARRARLVPGLRPAVVKALMDFARMMDGFSTLVDGSPVDAVRTLLDKSGYKRSLEISGLAEDQERLANIEEMITVAVQFMQNQPDGSVHGFLENVALSSNLDGYDKDSNCVSVMTLHSAKGLEFPVVFMIALEEGILPSSFALPGGPGDTTNTKEIEEERRLAFVGMTRAMHELYLGYCDERSFRGMTRATMPSRFIRDLNEANEAMEIFDLTRSGMSFGHEPEPWDFPHETHSKPTPIAIKPKPVATSLTASDPTHTTNGPPPKVREGSMVKHVTYGTGKVIEVSGTGILRRVKIQFKMAGVRAFILEKVKLEVVTF